MDVNEQTEKTLNPQRRTKGAERQKEEGGFNLKDVAMFGAEMLPGVGEALALKRTSDALDEKDYVGAGIEATAGLFGLIPGVGDAAGKALRATTRKLRKDAKLTIDNPGFDQVYQETYAETKQRASDEVKNRAIQKGQTDTYEANIGSAGGITGYADGVTFTPDELKDLPGAMGEEKFRATGETIIDGEPAYNKLKGLKESIAKEGYNPKGNILIHVREDGQPFIVEGNHRLAEALESGRETITADIRYLRGAEEKDGPLDPRNIFPQQTPERRGYNPEDPASRVFHLTKKDYDVADVIGSGTSDIGFHVGTAAQATARGSTNIKYDKELAEQMVKGERILPMVLKSDLKPARIPDVSSFKEPMRWIGDMSVAKSDRQRIKFLLQDQADADLLAKAPRVTVGGDTYYMLPDVMRIGMDEELWADIIREASRARRIKLDTINNQEDRIQWFNTLKDTANKRGYDSFVYRNEYEGTSEEGLDKLVEQITKAQRGEIDPNEIDMTARYADSYMLLEPDQAKGLFGGMTEGEPAFMKNKGGLMMQEGGAVPMAKQMDLFDDGGMKDQGNTTDPVSGNNVPVGSLQKEVRDDIPAQLSEGEFVMPADVVRYHGLDKMMELRDEAKAGLARMEAMGQMGNADEATIPEGVPFNIEDLDIDDDNPLQMQVGGMVPAPGQGFPSIPPGIATPREQLGLPTFTPGGVQQSQFAQYQPQFIPAQAPVFTPYTPSQQQFTPVQAVDQVPTFDQFLPRYVIYVNDQGSEMSIPVDANGNPLIPVPPGFKPKTDTPADPTPDPTPDPAPAPAPQQQDDPSDNQPPPITAPKTDQFGREEDPEITTLKQTKPFQEIENKVDPRGTFERIKDDFLGAIGASTTSAEYDAAFDSLAKSVAAAESDPKKQEQMLNRIKGMVDTPTRTGLGMDPAFLAARKTAAESTADLLAKKESRETSPETARVETTQTIPEGATVTEAAKPNMPESFGKDPTTGEELNLVNSAYQVLTGSNNPADRTRAITEIATLAGNGYADATQSQVDFANMIYGDLIRNKVITEDEIRIGNSIRDSASKTPISTGVETTLQTQEGTAGEVAQQSVDVIEKIAEFESLLDRAKVSPQEKLDYLDKIIAGEAAELNLMDRTRNRLVFTPGSTESVRQLESTSAGILRNKILESMESPTSSAITTTTDTGVISTGISPTGRPRTKLEDAVFEQKTARDRLDRAKSSNPSQYARDVRAGKYDDEFDKIDKARKEENLRRNSTKNKAGVNLAEKVGKENASKIRDDQGTATNVDDRGNIYYSSDHNWSKPTQTNVNSGGNSKAEETADTRDDKIVCTEMYRQTQLEDWKQAIKIWGVYEKKYLTPYHQTGYHYLFKPWVRGMQTSTILTSVGAYLAKARTQHLKYIMTKGKAKDSFVGNVWCKIIHPIVYITGRMLSWQKK